MRGIVGIAAAGLLMGSAPAPEAATVHLVVSGVRSTAGELRVCLWHEEASFPNCTKGQDVRRAALPAAPTVTVDFADLKPGAYAVSVIHDENANRKLDTSLVGLPREGVGFSRNPRILFGPPSFKASRFEATGETRQEIRLKYFL